MMTSTVDLRTLPMNIPSLCIPRVFANIDEKRIRRVFDELNMGIIDKVDIIGKTTEKGEKFNRVFVHFKRWFTNNSNADTARERLLNGKDIKIIYDDPWFWKVSAYRETSRPIPPPRQQEKKKATIQFDDDGDINKNVRQQANPRQQAKYQSNNHIIPIPELKRSVAETYHPVLSSGIITDAFQEALIDKKVLQNYKTHHHIDLDLL